MRGEVRGEVSGEVSGEVRGEARSAPQLRGVLRPGRAAQCAASERWPRFCK